MTSPNDEKEQKIIPPTDDRLLQTILTNAKAYQRTKQLRQHYHPSKLLGVVLSKRLASLNLVSTDLARQLHMEPEHIELLLNGELPESVIDDDLLIALARQFIMNPNVLRIIMRRNFTPSPLDEQDSFALGDAEGGTMNQLFQSLVNVLQYAQDPFIDHLEQLKRFVTTELKNTVFNLHDMQIPYMTESPESVTQIIPIAYQPHRSHHTYTAPDETAMTQHLSTVFDKYGGRILLLGDVGAGKTTALIKFALEKINDRLSTLHKPMPIYAPIRTWKYQESIPDWLVRVLNLDERKLREELEQRQVLLLLDGLDELETTDPLSIKSFELHLAFMQQLTLLTNHAMIVTCRTADYERMVLESHEKLLLNGAVNIQPFQPLQINEYLRDYKSLRAWLQLDPQLLTMVRRPLCLNAFITIYHNMRHQLDRAIESQHVSSDIYNAFFEAYVEIIYAFEQERSVEPLSYTILQIYEIFGSTLLDLYRFEGKQPTIMRVTDIEQVIGHQWSDFIALAERLYLIRTVDAQHFEFVHTALYRHFAIREALNQLKSDDDRNRYDAIQVLGLIGDARTIDLIAEMLSHQNTGIRQIAVWALSQIDHDGVILHLFSALRDGDYLVQVVAATALRRINVTSETLNLLKHRDTDSPAKAIWDTDTHPDKLAIALDTLDHWGHTDDPGDQAEAPSS